MPEHGRIARKHFRGFITFRISGGGCAEFSSIFPQFYGFITVLSLHHSLGRSELTCYEFCLSIGVDFVGSPGAPPQKNNKSGNVHAFMSLYHIFPQMWVCPSIFLTSLCQ